MRRLLYGPDGDPLALTADTAERLLSRRPSPGTPPAYAEVAGVLAAAAAPAHAGELAGAAQVLEAFRAAQRPSRARRAGTRTVRSRVIRTAALAAAVVLLLAGTALATGTLLAPADRAPRTTSGPHGQAPTTLGAPAGGGGAAPAHPEGSGGSNARSATSTPPLAGAIGLCRAYFVGSGDQKAKATAFQALATAAGGPDRVADYCRGLVPGLDTGRPDDAGPPAQQPVSPPADPGARGNGKGPSCQPGTGEADSCGNGPASAGDGAQEAHASDAKAATGTGSDR
jgi:hypothetical protein